MAGPASEWQQNRAIMGRVASWVLVVLGLVFVVVGLTYCRAASEGKFDDFQYSFVPLFVYVSIGLVLMLGGSIGLMHIEISTLEMQVLSAIQELKAGGEGESKSEDKEKETKEEKSEKEG